jgi:S-adenosylmethionine synthetase
MSMESAAGKNPVSHIGKLYAVVAHRLAAALVECLPGVGSATCVLASRIGAPVDRPRLVDVGLETADGEDPAVHRAAVEETLAAELAGVATLWRDLLAGQVRLF